MRTEITVIMGTHSGFETHGLPTAHYLLDSEAPIITIEFKSQALKELVRTMGLSDPK